MDNDPFYVGLLILLRDPTDTTGRRLIVASDDFGFVDDDGVLWSAARYDTTDGASIPAYLKPLVGYSFEEPYLKASVLHDRYCRLKTRTWQSTAKMFRLGLETSGVSRPRAFAMWSAVYSFGPHWPKPKEASP